MEFPLCHIWIVVSLEHGFNPWHSGLGIRLRVQVWLRCDSAPCSRNSICHQAAKKPPPKKQKQKNPRKQKGKKTQRNSSHLIAYFHIKSILCTIELFSLGDNSIFRSRVSSSMNNTYVLPRTKKITT